MRTARRLLAWGALLAVCLCGARVDAAPATTWFHQAESAANATDCGPGFQDSADAGYTGTGYASCRNGAGALIRWTVRVPASGPHRLTLRFANGSGHERSAVLVVGGVVRGDAVRFASTGGWSRWDKVSLDVDLRAGDNTIQIATAPGSDGLPHLDRLGVSALSGARDWGIALAESVMLRSPRPQDLGDWEYSRALVLHGMYLLYKRTGDARYLAYLKAWVDRHVDAHGDIRRDDGSVRSLSSLDYLLPGNVILDWWLEDPDPDKRKPTNRYRRALQTLRNRYTDASNHSGGKPTWSSAYPRTSDRGLWHAQGLHGQLWLDGVFMGQKFLVRYGHQFDERAYVDDEAATQLLVQHQHLKDRSTGLLWHAYDAEGDVAWTAPGTRHSQEFWCRAMGWYGMAMVETLEALPVDHPRRAALRLALEDLAAAWAQYQDDATGRWFQLVDKGADSRNWTETSCSSMYAYTLSRAVEDGFLDASYRDVAERGYRGVLAKISLAHDDALDADLTNLRDVSEGTNVGTESYYLARRRPVNDRHGLGAFLIMYEQLARPIPPPAIASLLDAAPDDDEEPAGGCAAAPTPGAGAFLVALGLAAIRRRRSRSTATRW